MSKKTIPAQDLYTHSADMDIHYTTQLNPDYPPVDPFRVAISANERNRAKLAAYKARSLRK